MRILLLIFSLFPAAGFVEALEIGVVDLNRALNESESGIRSKNILETRGRQKQQEFKLEEEELRQLAQELRSNPLLTPKAKNMKELQLKEGQIALREKVQQFEQQLRGEERRITEGIFKELKSSIRTVSLREKYDLVLEKNAAQVILYMKEDTTDLTQKVIDHYNSLKQDGKN